MQVELTHKETLTIRRLGNAINAFGFLLRRYRWMALVLAGLYSSAEP